MNATAAPKSTAPPPSENINSVNNATNTLEIDNHGYNTGDVVSYNDGTLMPVVGLVNRAITGSSPSTATTSSSALSLTGPW